MELFQYSIRELHTSLRARDITAKEVLASFKKRIDAVEPLVDSFNLLCFEEAERMAGEADARFAAGDKEYPLLGIPLAVKDNICTRNIPTTCSSKILKHFLPVYDATVIRRLKKEGMVLIGKTSMDEFAMGSSTENSCFKTTRNPWDLEKVPGGSSGGSAVAVAAGEAAAALGSDTGGSVRHPASFCGVVGLKPTYGRVPRFGLVAFASSLDQIGPLAGDVYDCALLLKAIAGRDASDATSADMAVPDYPSLLGREVRGLKAGIPSEYFGEGLDPEVEEAVKGTITAAEALGIEPVEISLPHTEYAVATYYIINTAEASSNLARFDGVRYGYRKESEKDLKTMYMETRREGFGQEVKRRIMLGTFALSSGYYDAYYLKARKVRTLIQNDFSRAFASVDFIITPVSPTVAFHLGEKIDDPLKMYLSDVYTSTASLAGIPALSIPCGFTDNGLPVGVQLMAPCFQEGLLLQIGYALENTLGVRREKPDIPVPGRESTGEKTNS